MKKNMFIVLFLSMIICDCSNESLEESPDLFTTQKSLSQTLEKLKTNKAFIDYINYQKTLKSENSNTGLMILDDGWNFGLSLLDFNTFNISFIGGTGTIEKMSNGKAKFSVHSKSPEAGMFNLFTGIDLWSNACIDSKGVINYNFISEYTEFSPFPGLTFYTPTGESSSAETANGHTQVSNSVPVYNEFGEAIDCTEGDQEKRMRLKAVWDANGENKSYILVIE